MVDCIAQVVCDYLLDLKFIRPYINRRLSIKIHLNLILFEQDLRRVHNAANQFRQIETIHHRLIVSAFQRRQCQKLLNHLVHLVGLINNNITIIVAAFLLLAHSFLKTFRVSLDQGDRCL